MNEYKILSEKEGILYVDLGKGVKIWCKQSFLDGLEELSKSLLEDEYKRIRELIDNK